MSDAPLAPEGGPESPLPAEPAMSREPTLPPEAAPPPEPTLPPEASRPPRRGLIGPFTGRQILTALLVVAAVAVGLGIVTAPVGTPAPTSPPVNASFFPVASPVEGLQPGDLAPELTGTVPQEAPNRIPGLALLGAGALTVVAGLWLRRRLRLLPTPGPTRHAGAGLAVVGLVVALAGTPLLLAAPPPPVTVGLSDLSGRPIRLADLRGRPVWIDFWASWCPPCQAETPVLQQLYTEHRAQGLALIAISVQETSPSDVQAYVQRYGLTFTVGFDATSAVFRAYQAYGLPTQVFIDRRGIVRQVVRGPVTVAQAEAILAPMLAATP